MKSKDVDTPIINKRNLVSQKGYLLIEILVSITLLSVGITGLIASQLQGTRSSEQASQYSNASNAVIALGEQLRLHSRDREMQLLSHVVSLDNEPNTLSVIQLRSYRALSGSMGQNSSASAEINCNEDTARQCQVCVSWLSSAQNQSLCIQTLLM